MPTGTTTRFIIPMDKLLKMNLLRRYILTAAALFCALLLSGCAERIAFSEKNIPVTAETIRLRLQSGETELLDKLPGLRRADFSGSLCYEELLAWAEAHPEVDTRYTVALPDGRLADNSEEYLDLSGLDSALAGETAELLRYLPALKRVELGGGLSPADLGRFGLVRPDIRYSGSFTLGGEERRTDETSLSLPGLSAAEIVKFRQLLPVMTALERVDLGSQERSPELRFADIAAFQALRPETVFAFDFTLFGREFSTTGREMDLDHVPMSDGGAAVREAISCMPELEYLDMDSCGVSDEEMAAIRDDFPDVNVVWRVWFGTGYSVRTDVEKILASQPSKGGVLTPDNTQSLQYCTKVKYLDLGHNPLLTDISFVSYMPELEVLIVAMDNWSDASPLASCPKLEYLELQTSQLSDLSPISALTELEHLNICYLFNLTDISPLYELPKIKRLWIGCLSPVPAEQIEIMQTKHPDCVINTTTYNPTDGGWRFIGVDEKTGAPIRAPRYDLLVDQFDYSSNAFSFSWLDPEY